MKKAFISLLLITITIISYSQPYYTLGNKFVKTNGRFILLDSLRNGTFIDTMSTRNFVRWYVANSAPGSIASVFGRIGTITAIESDYQSFYPRLSQSYSNPSWISSLAASKLTYTGTTAQYVRGDGSLFTFPTALSSFTNDVSFITASSLNTLTNKTLSGASNTFSSIPNSALTNSTISGISLGSNLNMLTIGTGLTGGSYDGSAIKTIAIDNTVVATLTGSQTITNKILNGTFNTFSNIPTSALTSNAVTINGSVVTLGNSITLTLASSNFANQGTATTVYHGNASGNGSFGQVVNADIANATIDAGTKLSGNLPITLFNSGTSASSTTAWFGDGTWKAVSSVLTGSLTVALTDGATINTDASLGYTMGCTYTVTLGGNRTIANPTNLVNGQRIVFRLKQDGTGGRTVTWDTKYRFSTDIPQPTLSTTASYIDFIAFIYNSTDDKLDVVGVNLGVH